jgi:glutamine---fructose-6-phosphate transaminase (isomerizing)
LTLSAQTTPFEADILEQPAALRRLADAGPVDGLDEATGRSWERIVLTGMGSSHFVGLPTWRALLGRGLPVWTVDSGQLLDTPELVTAETLVVATSQSGASGEVVALLDRIAEGGIRPGAVIGIADDGESPLATRSDLFLPLHSGPEATVSTKSYANSVGVHRALAASFLGLDPSELAADLHRVADVVEGMLDDVDVAAFAASTVAAEGRRVAMVGRSDDAATALLSGLITKESSKVAAEGHVGGQFRHGPFELAGPGLSVVLYGVDESEAGLGMQRLGRDLIETGSSVLAVGTSPIDGATNVVAPRRGPVEPLVTGAVVAEFLAVEFARAAGVVPGAFAFGSKVTTAL